MDFIGDGIFVLFGAPFAREDAAAQALRCAWAMQQAMDEVNIHSRKVGTPGHRDGHRRPCRPRGRGNIGSDDRVKYGVVGPPVNLAAHLQAHARAGEILAVGGRARARRRHRAASTSRGNVELKGRSTPVMVYPLSGAGAGMADTSAFFALTPDRVLDAVEVGGLRAPGAACRCARSRIASTRWSSRTSARLIVKFYRPGRWSRETILDEHRFLADLAEAELPAVPPMDLGTGTTLPEIDGILYAAFPKVRGRTLDEGDDERLRQIGRLIGRMHAVGAARPAPHRPRFTVDFYIRQPLEVHPGGKVHQRAAGRPLSRPRAEDRRRDRAPARARARPAHPRDLHWGNAIWGADGPILLDFDDCCVGPPIQDLWLLARGDEAKTQARAASS